MTAHCSELCPLFRFEFHVVPEIILLFLVLACQNSKHRCKKGKKNGGTSYTVHSLISCELFLSTRCVASYNVYGIFMLKSLKSIEQKNNELNAQAG